MSDEQARNKAFQRMGNLTERLDRILAITNAAISCGAFSTATVRSMVNDISQIAMDGKVCVDDIAEAVREALRGEEATDE